MIKRDNRWTGKQSEVIRTRMARTKAWIWWMELPVYYVYRYEFMESGKNSREVLIVTAYLTCKESIGAISSKTAFAQQWHFLMRQSGDTKPDPMKRFITDLDAFLVPHHTAAD